MTAHHDPHPFEILRDAEAGRVASCHAAVRDLEAGGFAWRARAAVRVLRNFTMEALGPPLKLAGFRRGVAVDLAFAPFGAYAEEILDPASRLGREPVDLVLLGLWLEDLTLAFGPSGELVPERVIEHVEGLVERLLARTAGRVALCTFAPPLRRLATPRDDMALARMNLAMLELGERHERVSVVDLRRLVERLGEGAALDPRGALLHRAPLRPELFALWAEPLADMLAAAHGAQRKVLALDCDGTLWGGVLGEDGPTGVRMSPDEYPGSAYAAFQEQVLALVRAGVLLVLCSKNEDAEVMSVLATHPRCRLRPEHVAARRINWQDKAQNLRELAEELHVGLDSFVFIDDSAYECAQVREALPMVEVRQAPERASDLCAVLRSSASMFGGGARTAEDLSRTQAIKDEERRAEAARRAGDLAAFLDSLELVAEIDPPEPEGFARVAQLTQRTNQLNATTRRYTADVIAELASRDDAIVLAMRAWDRFGGYGTVGVAIAVREGDAARLDTFLLSCRALGRRLEDALLGELRRDVAHLWGAIPLRAEYIATPKNRLLEGFFDTRGFTYVGERGGRKSYLATAQQVSAPGFIRVRRRQRP